LKQTTTTPLAEKTLIFVTNFSKFGNFLLTKHICREMNLKGQFIFFYYFRLLAAIRFWNQMKKLIDVECVGGMETRANM